ncbi:hypothetical protein [Tsukamurella hominis]|uniref:hypothetical protein n=1 Tax=Tsukamurella hominis TaxID=1970232 RepID=UPI0039ECCF41
MIKWEHIGQPDFDRVVEVLLRRRYGSDRWEAGAMKVTAFDGRGGDGGLDILIEGPTETAIYQLKYFPEGFSGGFVKRRDQITGSFKAALQHNPDRWVLVIPANTTPTERDVVEGLAAKHCPAGEGPLIEIVDRAELDSMIIDDPQVEAWFTRDTLKENAILFQRETDSLLNPGDLVDRVAALGGLAGGINPHWTWGFRWTGDAVICSLIARHNQAHIEAPITTSVTFTAADGTVQHAQVEKFRLYGRPIEDLVPATVTINLPEGLALGPTENLESMVRLVAADEGDAVATVVIDLLDDEGQVIASRRFDVHRIGASADGLGGTLRGDDAAGVAHFEALHRSRNDGSKLVDGGFRFYTTAINGRFPDDVLDSVDFLAGFTKATAMRVRPARGAAADAAIIDLPIGPSSEAKDEARFLATYVRALNVVQQYVPGGLPIPAELDPDEVSTVRLAATLLEAKSTDLVWDEFDVVLWPDLDPEAAEIFDNEHGFQLLQTLELDVTVDGVTHVIGAYTRIFHRALATSRTINEDGRTVVHVTAHPDNATLTAHLGVPEGEQAA